MYFWVRLVPTAHRNNCKQGGVLTAYCDSSLVTPMKSIKGSGESLISTVSLSPQVSFDIITYYRPPSENHLENLLSVYTIKSIQFSSITVGDFNLLDID